MTDDLQRMPESIDRARRIALGTGIVGALASAAGWFLDPAQFFRSYLWSYVFWVGFPLGCLGIVMLQHLTGGRWGISLRRILESGTRTLPLMAVAFLPILAGMPHLYIWSRPEVVAADELLQHKSAYLNIPFFTVRFVAYFGIWILLATLLNRWSARQDGDPDVQWTRKMQGISGPGIVLYVLTMTFASVDWMMSLEPHWFSTIYGFLLVSGQALAAMSFCIAIAILLAPRRPLRLLVTADRFQDLGKLLLTFVMVWAYFAFSQFLIIWAGNLPEEIPYYLRRLQGGWGWLGMALVLLQFSLPFLLLLSRTRKRDSRKLGRIAILVIAMRVVDVYWLTAPAFSESAGVHWMDLTVVAGLGGLWVSFFLWQLTRRPLLPVGDPYLREVLGNAAG
ncbi:MAG: hypothetical protein PVF68_14060 [Acidobacteriota bacterium]|jgi:hypothetical protein